MAALFGWRLTQSKLREGVIGWALASYLRGTLIGLPLFGFLVLNSLSVCENPKDLGSYCGLYCMVMAICWMQSWVMTGPIGLLVGGMLRWQRRVELLGCGNHGVTAYIVSQLAKDKNSD